MQVEPPAAAIAFDVWSFLIPKNLVEAWTMVTGMASVAVTIIAAKGLKSLRLAKGDMVTRARRESREIAIRKCEEFADDIIAKNAPILTDLAAKGVQPFKQPKDVQFGHIDAALIKSATAWVGALPTERRREAIQLLNELEAWAMYFTNGVADHEIVFGPCAPAFCSLVVQYYGILVWARSMTTSGHYPNITKLYDDWSGQLEKQQLGLKQDDLKRQIKELEAKPTLPAPLGTKVD